MIYNLQNYYYNGLIIPMEIWKPITEEMVPNVKPVYYISNIGNIYNAETGRYATPHVPDNDYLRLILRSKDGKQISTTIHRLVALAFHGLPPNDGNTYFVDHIDCSRTCNCENNLEWVTAGENTKRAYKNGLNPSGEERYNAILSNDDVIFICESLSKGTPLKEIACNVRERIYPKTGNIEGIISTILHRTSWTSISCNYEFANYSRRRLTDSEIKLVCEALEANTKYDDIIQNVLKLDNLSKQDIENYKELFYHIKRGRRFSTISSKYNINKEGSTTIP